MYNSITQKEIEYNFFIGNSLYNVPAYTLYVCIEITSKIIFMINMIIVINYIVCRCCETGMLPHVTFDI